MKRVWQIPGIAGGLLVASRVVHAHCPLCTAAVGAGILGAQYLGLGDGVVGLFTGGFGLVTGLWVGNKLKTRFIPFQSILLAVASWVLTVIPLSGLSDQTFFVPLLWFGEAGSFFNSVHFVSKFLIGSVLGGVVTVLALQLHAGIKQWRGGVLFPFQGVVLPLAALLFAGGILFVLWGGGG